MLNINFVYILIFFLISLLFFNYYLKFSVKKKINDKNDFNVGYGNTPTGAGVIFLIVFFLGSICLFYIDQNFKSLLPNRFYLFYFSILLLGIISFYDDMNSLDPILRLVIQFILVFISTSCLDFSNIVLPLKLSMLLAIIIWIYLINITNFIDGLDCFLATHFIFFILNIFLIKYYLNLDIFSFYLSIIFFPIIFAFIFYNKPIAKLYMGDTGSIIIGYVIGFCFLELALAKHYLLAISIYIYPLTDCTITLIKKVFKGHYPWTRLFDYYFLIPVIKEKKSHGFVLKINLFFLLINFLLVFMQIKITSLFFFLNCFFTIIHLLIYRKNYLKK